MAVMSLFGIFIETNYSIYVTTENCNTFPRFIKLKE